MVKNAWQDGNVGEHPASPDVAAPGADHAREGARVVHFDPVYPVAAAATATATTTTPPDADADDGDSGRSGSPLGVFEADEPRRRWPRIVLTTIGVAVVLAGAYVGASWALGDKVPRGTTVAGVEIGGQDAATATATLTSGLARLLAEPIPVVAGENSTTVAPAEAGLVLDAHATVAALTGFDLSPRRLWNQIVGLGAEQPVTTVDHVKLAAAIDTVSQALATEPVDGAIVFADSAPHVTPAADGSAVDAEAAATLLARTWLTGSRPIALPTHVVAPAVTQDEADKAMSRIAAPLAGAPISVAVAGQTIELPASVVTSLASFVATDKGLTLQLDGPGLVQAIVDRTTNLLSTSADASFAFVDGVPSIVPGTPGTTIDPTALAAAVAAAGVATDRTARIELVPSDPAQSTAKLQALGITELVSEFSTPLTNEPLRTENLAIGAGKITGTLVLPGETFSLTDALGPVTAAAGFNDAWVIVNGEHIKGIGGGLSQMSTTTFNAAYLAGFEDVEHTPHSEWFTRYPEGREATIYIGSIDMKFKNTSPTGALLRSWIEAGRLHVAIWGTKYWTVESSTSGRSRVVAPTTVHSTSPTCTSQSAGNPGFTVTVTRVLKLNGEVKETTHRTTHYKPQNAVVCGP